MITTTPLDVLLLILRLLTIKDALSLFATCRWLRLSDCRPFWVYANIDADSLPRTPGCPRIDYSTWKTEALRARVLQKWSIYDAWINPRVEPRRIRSIHVDYEIRRIVAIPWTNLAVLLGGQDVFIQDLVSGAKSMVPLKPYWEMLIVSVKLVWIDCIGSNVLIVHLAGQEAHTSGTVSELQLFSIDTANMSASFIASLAIPHGIAGIDLRGRHLAVIGYGNVRVSHIRSFEVEFGHISSVTAIATIRVMTPDVLRATSFAILDESRFLVAGPKGIAIYKLPARSIAACGLISYRVRALWRYSYDQEDTISRPPLGPIRRNCTGTFTISVSTGNYLRCVYEVPGPGSKSHFIVKERRLVDRLPVYLGIASGYQVGVYRRPYSMPAFTSFSLDGQQTELHPFFYATDRIVTRTGSIAYRAGVLETLEPGTLQMDEDQGRILFMLRSHVKPSAKIVVLELV